jgi:hypothetical protein
MKKTMLLVLMTLGLAAAAFAQVTPAIFTGATENVTLVVSSGHTELTGDVILSLLSGTTVQGTITFKYNVPFTCPLNGATGTPVVSGTIAATLDEAASDAVSGMLVIDVPANASGSGQYIRVHGVRLDVSGSPKPAYTVTLSSTGNAIFNGQFSAPVIDGAAPGLKYGDTTEVQISAINPKQDPAGPPYYAGIELDEGFNSAFGKIVGAPPDGDPSQTISQMIKITLSAAPPAGVTITFPGMVGSNGTAAWTRASSTGAESNSNLTFDSTSTSLSVYYRLSSSNDPVLPETFMLDNIAVNITAKEEDLPLVPANITYTATLAPNDPAFDANGKVTGLPIPRYAVDLVQGKTLLSVAGSSTVLLAPLAQNMPSIGYDTGISVANTTLDPGAELLGITGAIPQAGKIAFRFYQQQTPSAAVKVYTYVTDGASPGTGLDATGMLQPGSTYTVLASQLLEAAGVTDEFQGYMVIITNFTNAHGLYVASNFQTFSQGSPLMVIRTNRQDVPESLGQ